jgi:FtsH-binding integral membrane protein
MLQKILSGYKKLLSALFKTLALFVLCVAFGFLLVYPLWFFATTQPHAYTVTVFCVFAVLVALFVFFKARASLQGTTSAERQKKAASLALAVVKIATVILGVCAACALVLYGKRLFALAAVIATAVIYGICAFGAKNN